MSHSSTAAHFVAGREPYRGKWRIQPETMSKRAAEVYAADLIDQGWRDVLIGDLATLKYDLVTLSSAYIQGAAS